MSDKFTCPRRDEMFAYQGDRKNEDAWRDDDTCSYCGSASPERFLEAIERGEEVTPTDKSYKAYIGGSGHGKFYYAHLSEEQRAKFIELYNQKKMRIGYPGYFYVLPYFARSER